MGRLLLRKRSNGGWSAKAARQLKTSTTNLTQVWRATIDEEGCELTCWITPNRLARTIVRVENRPPVLREESLLDLPSYGVVIRKKGIPLYHSREMIVEEVF